MPRIIGLAVALSAVLAVIVLAFSWPSVTADPRNVPIAVVGPEPAVALVEANLAQVQPGAVELVTVADRDAAINAIKHREVYGAIILGASPEVLTASASSTIVTQLVAGIGAGIAQATGAPVTTTDIVPLSSDDPRGSGLAAAMFPLVLGGMIGGIGISFAVHRPLLRVLALTIYSIVGGLLVAGILQGWFGVLPGNYWTTAGVIALSIAAITAPITGLVALVGRAGVALGPLVFMLFANPISGAQLPPEFLPGAWGAIGQWFPPGASSTLLRVVSYFPDADASFNWLVLLGWVAVGIILSVFGHVGDRTARPPADAQVVTSA